MRSFMSFLNIVRFGVLAGGLLAAPLANAQAVRGPSVIRDAEMESTIHSYADPLFRAAGIPINAVSIRVLNDTSLNAFVTSGNRMFIHSGLLLATDTPGQLIGVIAHETGHIAGGHMARLPEEIEKATLTSLASMALGVVAGLATGRGDVGMAAMTFGQHAAAREFFAYTRTQESAADQFAIQILDGTHQSSSGLLEFFERLEGQEILASARQDPYVRTHPLTAERVTTIRAHVETSPYSKVMAPTPVQAAHDRMIAKLFAFLQPQSRTFQRYPENDASVAARYARAVAYFRRGQITEALGLIDGLLADMPNDPYFEELKGQMLTENQRLPEARVAYEKALSLAPQETLIAVSLAHVLVELGDPAALKQAEPILRRALTEDPNNTFAWRLLGTTHGRQNRETEAAYDMAEYALRTGEYAQALFHTDKALQTVKQSDPIWLRLQDIRQAATTAIDRIRKER